MPDEGVYVYIDAFNLYYGALKKTPYKWLNVRAMCEQLFAGEDIRKIYYCTANVKPRNGNTTSVSNQNAYLRALATLDSLVVVKSYFKVCQASMYAVNRPPDFVDVVKTEEKGTDVNIASHLLADGYRRRYEKAVVISGDSDLCTPIELVKNDLQKEVVVVVPGCKRRANTRPRVNRGLQNAASRIVCGIDHSVLSNSQFPGIISDSHGVIHKPTRW